MTLPSMRNGRAASVPTGQTGDFYVNGLHLIAQRAGISPRGAWFARGEQRGVRPSDPLGLDREHRQVVDAALAAADPAPGRPPRLQPPSSHLAASFDRPGRGLPTPDQPPRGPYR